MTGPESSFVDDAKEVSEGRNIATDMRNMYPAKM